MKINIWRVLFFILLVINIIFTTLYFTSNGNTELESKNHQIDLLKSELNKSETEYVENAKQLKYILETIIDNSSELKKDMVEYKNVTDKEFEEKLRQKIVRLNIEIEQNKNEGILIRN